MPEAVLFDLDGTLADTAPDLGGALNELLAEQGQPALPIAELRRHASNGVRGLVGAGFGIAPGEPHYASLQSRFLDLYAARLCKDSTLFDGIAELLGALDERGIAWGIVTNKAQRFTLPLVEALGLEHCRCVVSGDSAPRPKPHPGPLHLASHILRCEAQNCLYVGDDLRDILSGRAAGMRTVAAAYGYLGSGEPPQAWNADWLVEDPLDIMELLAR